MSIYSEKKDENIKKRNEEIDAEKKKAEELVNKSADEAIQRARNELSTKTTEANQEYRDSILRADLQKELDLRDIRESMAKSGMARSGISQTQQTAAVLSAGNKSAKADRQRLATIDALNKSLEDYKNEMNLERENKLFSLQQYANEQKRAYADSQTQWAEGMDLEVANTAETNRRNALTSLGLDDATWYKAINDGWTIEQGVAEKQRLDAERKAAIDSLVASGQISEYIGQAAKVQGYTAEQALALQAEQNETDRKNIESYAIELLGKGYITADSYNRAKNGEIGIGELAREAKDYVESHQTPAGTDWTEDLETMWKNKELTDEIYDLAKQNNLSVAISKRIDGVYVKAKEILGENPSYVSKRDAVGYVLKNSLGYETDNIIFGLLGITDADVDEYSAYNDNLLGGSSLQLNERKEVLEEKKWRRVNN